MKWVLSTAVVGLLLAAGGAGAAAVIDGGDVRNNSLTGRDVRNKSLTKADFRGTMPINANRIIKHTAAMSVAPGAIDTLTVPCPPGEAVVSGGWTIIGGATVPYVDKSYDDVSWSVGIDNFDAQVTTADSEVYAYCAPAGGVVAANTSKRERLIAADEARQRATHR